MGKTIRASALILLLACSAQAGWMGNGTPPPPPPPETQMVEQEQASIVQESTADGDTQKGATDSLTATVLDLLADVLSLV